MAVGAVIHIAHSATTLGAVGLRCLYINRVVMNKVRDVTGEQHIEQRAKDRTLWHSTINRQWWR